MPTHKGIKLAIVSQWELKTHPEFPHPDSSQFTFRSPGLNKAESFLDFTPPSASSDSKADRLLGRQTCVSVYIPSLSGMVLPFLRAHAVDHTTGSRFWIRYSITEAAVATSQ